VRAEEWPGEVIALALRPLEPERVEFLPGQFFMLAAGESRGKPREVPLSCASAPGEPEMCFAARARGEGPTAAYLLSLREGDEVPLRGPFGAFVPDLDSRRELLLVAMGTGVTPVRSMLRWFLRERPSDRRIVLVLGARREEELLWDAELRALAVEHERFTYVPVVSRPEDAWQGRRGRATGWLGEEEERLRALAGSDALEACLCGSLEMVQEARELLQGCGLDRRWIRFEEY
jgi:NAD(P)H-flavin reductase